MSATPEGQVRPELLLFDVNETLLDLRHLEPLFVRLFADKAALRLWFAQMILYSQSLTLCGSYQPLSKLGAGALRMLAAQRGVGIEEKDLAELRERTQAAPAHAGAAEALGTLRDAGFRLATLTNSAPPTDGPSPLERAGLAPYFERSLSVDAVGRFKPAPECYRSAAAELGVAPSAVCMVAAHPWDLFGAQAVGCRGALVIHPGVAPFAAEGLPEPDVVAQGLPGLAKAMVARWP